MSSVKIPAHIARVFEYVGCYATDVFYNHLFVSAVNKKKNSAQEQNVSLTDEYRKAVMAFSYATKNDRKCYLGIVKGIFTFYQTHTYNSASSFDSFINMFIGLFVPSDYETQLSKTHKDQTLMRIIISLIDGMAVFATRVDTLKLIIDQHSSRTNVVMMQDHARDLLIMEREKIFSMFVRASAAVDPSHDMHVQNREQLREALAKIRRVEEECARLRAENTKLKTSLHTTMTRMVEMQRAAAAAPQLVQRVVPSQYTPVQRSAPQRAASPPRRAAEPQYTPQLMQRAASPPRRAVSPPARRAVSPASSVDSLSSLSDNDDDLVDSFLDDDNAPSGDDAADNAVPAPQKRGRGRPRKQA